MYYFNEGGVPPTPLNDSSVTSLARPGATQPLSLPTAPAPRQAPLTLPGAQGGSVNQSGTGIVPGMADVYNQLLGLNQQNYSNVLNAYNSGQNNLSSNLPSIAQGYGNLSSQVMNTLGMGKALGQNGNWGVAQPAATAIGKSFTSAQGSALQGLLGSGLANSTVLGNLYNQNAQNAGNAYAQLGSSLAQTAAGYQSNLGLAGLAQRMQGLEMQSGLTQAALGPIGERFANTAGNLTGNYGYGLSQYPPYGSRGGGGGSQSGFGNPGSPAHAGTTDPYANYQSGYGQGAPGGVPEGNPYTYNPSAYSDFSGGAGTFAGYGGYPMGAYDGGFQTDNYSNLGSLGNGFGGGFDPFGTGAPPTDYGVDASGYFGDPGGYLTDLGGG